MEGVKSKRLTQTITDALTRTECKGTPYASDVRLELDNCELMITLSIPTRRVSLAKGQ